MPSSSWDCASAILTSRMTCELHAFSLAQVLIAFSWA